MNLLRELIREGNTNRDDAEQCIRKGIENMSRGNGLGFLPNIPVGERMFDETFARKVCLRNKCLRTVLNTRLEVGSEHKEKTQRIKVN